MDLKVVLTTRDTRKRIVTVALLDRGCTKTSIDLSFVRRKGLKTRAAKEAVPVRNADGSLNGYVKEYVELEVEVADAHGRVHRELLDFQVVNLGGKHDIFVGYDWLEWHNPLIDWKDRELIFAHCPDACGENPVHEELRAAAYCEHLCVFATKSTQIAMSQKCEEVKLPDAYRDFSDVFDKTSFDTLPE